MDILSFTSSSHYQSKDNRTVFTVQNPWTCEDFDHLIGRDVEINGQRYQVIGVERFLHEPPWRKGETISLQVE